MWYILYVLYIIYYLHSTNNASYHYYPIHILDAPLMNLRHAEAKRGGFHHDFSTIGQSFLVHDVSNLAKMSGAIPGFLTSGIGSSMFIMFYLFLI